MIAGCLLYPQQQVTGNVLRTDEVRCSGRGVALTAYNVGFGFGRNAFQGATRLNVLSTQ